MKNCYTLKGEGYLKSASPQETEIESSYIAIELFKSLKALLWSSTRWVLKVAGYRSFVEGNLQSEKLCQVLLLLAGLEIQL